MVLIVSVGNLVVSLLDLTVCVDPVLPSYIYHCYVQMPSRRVSCLFIIQQIVTMPIYGKEAFNICHPT